MFKIRLSLLSSHHIASEYSQFTEEYIYVLGTKLNPIGGLQHGLFVPTFLQQKKS